MQRRAAAISTVVLLLISAGAYAFVGVAEEPSVDVEGEHALSVGQTVTGTDGTVYNASSVSGDRATFGWTTASATYTATWENNSTVTLDATEYQVATSAADLVLRERLNVTAILAEDDRVADDPVTVDGERYVVFTATDTLTPLGAYLPEPSVLRYGEGQVFDYAGNETTVANLTAERARLQWTAPRTNSVTVSAGGNVTLDRTYLAHFPGGDEVVLSTAFDAYQSDLDRVSYYNERVNGLWAVSILSALAAVLLLGMAYLPSRY